MTWMRGARMMKGGRTSMLKMSLKIFILECFLPCTCFHDLSSLELAPPNSLEPAASDPS